MSLPDPNNCWPRNEQKFADALAASAMFQTLIGAGQTPGDHIFGRRFTHPRSGRTWDKEELASLTAYGMVFGDPGAPYGKRWTVNGRYLPFGQVTICLNRFLPDDELVHEGEDTHPSDKHDRDSQNYYGTIIDQILTWLRDNGGPYPVNTVQVLDFSETPSGASVNQGVWQGIQADFSFGREA